jgi:hypothetical protein
MGFLGTLPLIGRLIKKLSATQKEQEGFSRFDPVSCREYVISIKNNTQNNSYSRLNVEKIGGV